MKRMRRGGGSLFDGYSGEVQGILYPLHASTRTASLSERSLFSGWKVAAPSSIARTLPSPLAPRGAGHMRDWDLSDHSLEPEEVPNYGPSAPEALKTIRDWRLNRKALQQGTRGAVF